MAKRNIGMWLYQNSGGEQIQKKMIKLLKERDIDVLANVNLKNDNAKNELSRLGKVHLIRTTNEKLTLIELEKLFEGFEYLLEEGATDATDKKDSYEEKRKAYKKAASDYRHEQYLKFAEKKRAATKARKISEADSKRNKKN